ncbi:uncharacterized protein LY89DRAFT_452500 [Mollisia scopiformis]|uniref:Uncharacterized protein n=1 Tax=Mollisia scopiformis TaxID=149040 RepID=A0A194XKS1_MOLSC|nr:uncharacterized protein LY89DRAFT_452500 [Mollisia scopiformis]KUJ20694.1 hypothetical protein LY89DRAFT_452500 [Mollisia scopiformis]
MQFQTPLRRLQFQPLAARLLTQLPSSLAIARNALAEFDIVWWFLSFGLPTISYTAYGNWGTCYNIPGLFGVETGSIKPESGSPGCWVYPKTNCVGNYTVIGPKGDDIWDGSSGSFICDPPASK